MVSAGEPRSFTSRPSARDSGGAAHMGAAVNKINTVATSLRMASSFRGENGRPVWTCRGYFAADGRGLSRIRMKTAEDTEDAEQRPHTKETKKHEAHEAGGRAGLRASVKTHQRDGSSPGNAGPKGHSFLDTDVGLKPPLSLRCPCQTQARERRRVVAQRFSAGLG